MHRILKKKGEFEQMPCRTIWEGPLWSNYLPRVYFQVCFVIAVLSLLPVALHSDVVTGYCSRLYRCVLFFRVSSSPALWLRPYHFPPKYLSPPLTVEFKPLSFVKSLLATCETERLSPSKCSEFPCTPSQGHPPPFPGFPASGVWGSEISALVQNLQGRWGSACLRLSGTVPYLSLPVTLWITEACANSWNFFISPNSSKHSAEYRTEMFDKTTAKSLYLLLIFFYNSKCISGEKSNDAYLALC